VETVRENSVFGRDRRRGIRHPVHTPAYATLSGSAQGAVLEFCEILNIAERGMCIQASAPMKVNRLLPLVLDLSETSARIHTTGHVVWSDPSGKTGIRFPEMPEASRAELQRWLAVNDMARGAAGPLESPAAEADPSLRETVRARPSSASSYSSMLQEWAEIESDATTFGPDLEPALQMIAERALTLTWASGAAIALMNKLKPSELVCRARAGSDAPEMGARLQAGAGFSGECVRAATTLKCDDAMTDTRVERNSCRALGIRSLIACPIKRRTSEVIGILEVFSPEPAAFWDNDATVLERLAHITAEVLGRAEHIHPDILAVHYPEDEPESNLLVETLHAFEDQVFARVGSSWRRKLCLLLTGIVAVTLTIWLIAPWIADSLTRFISRSHLEASAVSPTDALYSGMEFKQLREIAVQGDAVAEYWLGIHYARGGGVKQDYHEAMAWFLKAADDGEVRATAKMASCYWAGKGAPRDYSKAYFWGLLAQAAGDETGRAIVIHSAPHLSDHQRFAEQQQAEAWLRSHHLRVSP
jgi:putative methionine-R-sulfoxide reductase with GAF domain